MATTYELQKIISSQHAMHWHYIRYPTVLSAKQRRNSNVMRLMRGGLLYLWNLKILDIEKWDFEIRDIKKWGIKNEISKNGLWISKYWILKNAINITIYCFINKKTQTIFFATLFTQGPSYAIINTRVFKISSYY